MTREINNLVKRNLSNNEQRTTNNGFSLVEVMVGGIILGVSLLTIYGVYIKTFQASSRTEEREIATAIAQETMENIVNRPYVNVALWAGTGVNPAPPTSNQFTDKAAGGATNQVTESTVRAFSGTASSYITYQQTVTRSGVNFTVTNLVTWHDDDSDGTGASDPDPNDYKRVHITVQWTSGHDVILDRFVSLYFRPNASATTGADAGEFRLSDSPNYARLGSTNLEVYSGGNRTSDAESKGFSTYSLNTGSSIAWVEKFTDDDNGSSYLEQDSASETLNSLSNSPIYFKTGASNVARVEAGAAANILRSATWHRGEFTSTDGWLDNPSAWPSPPSWSTTWKQPSAIAKNMLSNGFYWDYSPAQTSIKLFEIGETRAGSIIATTSDVADNKVAARSWTKTDNIKIIETEVEDGVAKPIVSIDSVETRVEAYANGISGGANESRYWKITNLKVQGDSNYYTIEYPNTLPAITLPQPIQSIVIGSTNTQTVQSDGKKAQAEVVALTITIKANPDYSFTYNSQNITVPDSAITLGTTKANVSYSQ